MKIGILSDIHADAVSLDKAIKLLERKGADQLICAGDLVDGETEGDAAAQRIKALNIPVVMGNHDQLYARLGANPRVREAAAKNYTGSDALTDDTYAYLATLPHTRELEYDGVKLVLAHANTWDYLTYLFPSAGTLPKAKQLKDSIPPDVHIVVLGHTHLPMWMKYFDLHIFNPGSVESNRYSHTQSCALLNLPTIEYTVYEINRGVPLTIETFDFYPY